MTSTNTSQSDNNSRRSPLQKLRKHLRVDIPFLILVLLLLAVGLMMLFSAAYAKSLSASDGKTSYMYIKRQLIFAAIGLFFMFIASIIPPKFYTRFIPLFYCISVFLLIFVLVFSKDSEKRWIYLGGSAQFQPSEIAKVAVIMLMAQYIKQNKNEMQTFVKGFVVPFLIYALPAGLVLVETHLSGGILIFGVGLIMHIVGGVKKRYLPIIFVLLLIAAAVVVIFTNYMQDRISIWLDPMSDITGKGHQPYQSLISIGSGGLFGLGYGKSRQKYLFLPEPQNDFIFSIVSEELGFVGVVLIIILFAFLILRGIYISVKANNTFQSLMSMGIISRVALQVILNLAVVTNSIPTTGISLPFFSYGGTALIILLAEMGLVLQVSKNSYLN